MIARCRFALLILGLSLGLGCTSATSHFHRHRSGGDAGAEPTPRTASVDAPVEASWPADGSIDSEPGDSKEDGRFIDSTSGDGDDSEVGTADAGGEGSSGDGSRSCGRSAWILTGEVPNVRQLGGIPLAGGGTVACDLVYRGSALSSLGQEGCRQFSATGIRTVIDLRSQSEQLSPPSTCVTERAKLVSAPMPTPYNVSPKDYLADLYTAESIRSVFAVLANRAAYPVYYHCLYGKDRTGVLTAVILSALGVPRQTIQDEYALSAEAGMSIYPQSLAAVLDEFDRLGGVDAYFRAVGVPAEQVQAMRAILTAR